MAAEKARRQWEAENRVQTVGDDVYRFNLKTYQQTVLSKKPWRDNPRYFQECHLSALSVLKMTMHALRGGSIEVMGMIEGYARDGTIIITDAVPLPVEGTRVMRAEGGVGWYHSHPGYGCWLSGIDVMTQSQWQMTDPMVAVVVDPKKTAAAGRVEIGVFRTYPEGYTPPDAPRHDYQTIPADKIEQFGVHADRYYKLKHFIFKSTSDEAMLKLLWNRYWATTLSSSPLMANRAYTTAQLSDVTEKLQRAQHDLHYPRMMGMGFVAPPDRRREEAPLSRVDRDGSKATMEVMQGLMMQATKALVFNTARGRGRVPP